MININAIAVFCGSSEGNDKMVLRQAQYLGKVLANNKITLVYGAAKIGVMGKVAQAALDSGGKVIGVIPEFLKLKEVVHLGLTDLITTQTMHERKLIMHEHSDAFIALPGGFGTLEELFEIITWAQLGLHQKPIGILNANGFYDNLIRMFDTMIEKGLLKKENLDLIVLDDNVDGLIFKMKNYIPQDFPKWLQAEKT